MQWSPVTKKPLWGLVYCFQTISYCFYHCFKRISVSACHKMVSYLRTLLCSYLDLKLKITNSTVNPATFLSYLYPFCQYLPTSLPAQNCFDHQWVTHILENFYCRKLLGLCMEIFGQVDVVFRSGAVFHKRLLFYFIIMVRPRRKNC